MYIYIYIYIHTHIVIYTYMYIHTYIYIYRERDMYTCMHVCMYACIHICMYTSMHVCMYTCIHVCMYTCMCIYIYIYMYICIHIYQGHPLQLLKLPIQRMGMSQPLSSFAAAHATSTPPRRHHPRCLMSAFGKGCPPLFFLMRNAFSRNKTSITTALCERIV